MKTWIKGADWPAHLAAVALLLLILVPAAGDAVAPVLVSVGAALAVVAAFGLRKAIRRPPRGRHV